MAICLSCGAITRGRAFCHNCGAAQPPPSAAPTQRIRQPIYPPAAAPRSISTAAPALPIVLPAQPVEHDIWQEKRQDLPHLLSVGVITRARYRLTTKHLYVERGIAFTTSEEYPLWAVLKVDIWSSPLQKLRGLGTLIVYLKHPDYKDDTTIKLPDVEEPENARAMIRDLAQQERDAHDANKRVFLLRP